MMTFYLEKNISQVKKLNNKTVFKNIQLSSIQSLSRVRLFVTPWTVAHQAPLSMEFSRQEYCSGWPVPFLGDLPNSGIEPASPVSTALTSGFFTTEPPWKPMEYT